MIMYVLVWTYKVIQLILYGINSNNAREIGILEMHLYYVRIFIRALHIWFISRATQGVLASPPSFLAL